MEHFPLFVRLSGKNVLVVGGGEVAFHKTLQLVNAGARVSVVSPDFHEKFDELGESISRVSEPYRPSLWTDGLSSKRFVFVVAATNQREVNRQVALDAEEAGVFVNVVDLPSEGDVIFPSIVDRSPIQIAVSTGGTSPVLARLLRGRLEAAVPERYGRLASLIGRHRSAVKHSLADSSARGINVKRGFWEEVIEGPIGETVLRGDETAAEEMLRAKLDAALQAPTGNQEGGAERERAVAAAEMVGRTSTSTSTSSSASAAGEVSEGSEGERETMTHAAAADGNTKLSTVDETERTGIAEDQRKGKKGSVGEVYLVGAGPGDPSLLTLRALQLMQRADVVVHDRLVSKDILQKCRRDALMINAGKEPNNHTIPQDECNSLLCRLAEEGRRVCRLKGGDPFVFGRGGEELAQLRQRGIPFEVVPGITAAQGCAAYSGIPLTHRDHAQSVRFLTGHARKDGELHLPWKELAAATSETLCVYMGVGSLSSICKRLLKEGMAPTTQLAVVEQGTCSSQRVFVSSVERAHLLLESESPPRNPALIIIGGVVSLRDECEWLTQEDQKEKGKTAETGSEGVA